MKLNFSVTTGLEIGREEKVNKARKVISERKKVKEDLLKRAKELKAQAEACRRSDPAKSRSLEHRSILLQNEEYRMRKENEHPMTYEQLRRSALCGQCALLVDGEKK